MSFCFRYWFDCGCQACQNDWPLLSHLRNDAKLGRSKEFSKGKELVARGRVGAARKELSKAIDCHYASKKKTLFDEAPCEEAIRAEDKLRTALANMGNLVFLGGSSSTTKAK